MVALSGNNPFLAPTQTPQASPPDVIEFDGGAEASFKGIPLWCTSMRKVHASAVARHRYPNVPGQTIEPMGREPIMVELETVWFGEDWQDRLETLIFNKDAEQTSGRLVLPGARGEFDAFLVTLSDDTDLMMQGASVSLSFEEDAHVDVYCVASASELDAAERGIPATQTAVSSDFDTYSGLVTATSTPPTREAWAALSALEVSIVTAQAALDTMTQTGVADYLALTRVRFHARRAFPDPGFMLTALA